MFTNTSGDELWSNPANWLLGVVPDSTMDVTFSGAVTEAKIPNGHIAKCNILNLSIILRVQLGGELKAFKKIYVYTDGELINNGKIILPPNNYGIYITSGGKLTNNEGDSILIQSTTQDPVLFNFPLDSRGGFITNRGIISITGSDEHVAINTTYLANYYGKISNKSTGQILIDQAKDAGIRLQDSLENFGLIDIKNVTYISNPSFDTYGLWIEGTFARIVNKGTFIISNVGEIGIWNDGGNLYNDVNGEINIGLFEEVGFKNDGIFTTYGDINITGNLPIAYNKGIWLSSGSSFFKGGSETTIIGNNYLDYGIFADRNFINDSASIVKMESIDLDGFHTTTSLFTNRGYYEVKNCLAPYSLGIHMLQSVFKNYGEIYFENIYSGIRIYSTWTADNYGSIICKNLTSYGMNTNGDFINRSGSNFLTYHTNMAAGFSSCLFHTGDNSNGTFTNDGNIIASKLHLGIDFRTGDIINNGNIIIDSCKWGIDLGVYNNDPCVFTNNGTVNIINQTDPQAASIVVESPNDDMYNFVNNVSGILNFEKCGTGLRISSGGMKNDGQITFSNITDKCIYSLPVSIVNYEFRNSSTGSIIMDTAAYGIYFFISTANTNRIPVINDGIFYFQDITNEGIDGNINYVGFTNNGTISGYGQVDCNYVTLENQIKPGYNGIGAIQPNNFVSSNPSYTMDIRGNSGFGLPLGHDGILFNAAVAINGTLHVNLLNGFTPALNKEYVLFFNSISTITGLFSSVNLPNFATDREFQIQYLSDRIKLVVVPKFKIWTGATSTTWTVATNWSDGVVPDSNSFVKIPNVVNDPVIANGAVFVINKGSAAANIRCKSLTIDAGAIITFNNTVINNYGDVLIHGTLIHHDLGIGNIKNWTGSNTTVFSGGSLQMDQ